MKYNCLFTKHIILIFALSFISLSSGICIAVSNYKNDYKGLIPGNSTLDDTYRALGKPRKIKKAGKGRNYYFKDVIVNFAGNKASINTIQIIKDFNYVSPNGISLNNNLQKVKRSINNPVIKNNVVIDKINGVIYWLKNKKVIKIVLRKASPLNDRFINKKLSKRKCTEVDDHYSKKMTYMGICKYRNKGCIITSNYKQKIVMHCVEKNINDCFENESWKTINELVGLKYDIEVSRISKNTSIIKGEYSSQVCAQFSE